MTWGVWLFVGIGGIVILLLRRIKARSGFSQAWHRDLDRDSFRNTYDGQSLDWTKVRADFAAYRDRTRT